MRHLVAPIAIACAACAFAPLASAAEPPRELHGSADAFAAPGVALAWAVLRGAGDGATVVIRIAADPSRYASVSASAVDPFTQKRTAVLAPTATSAAIDVHVPRAQFADYPRSEFRFEAARAAATSDLVVYYAGVPDTTPELVSSSELDAYLTQRIARVTAEARGK